MQSGVFVSLVFAAISAGSDNDFDRKIAPILVRHCLDCHSGPKPKGELDLSTREGAFEGGDSGPAVVASNLGKSLLWEQIVEGEMPPKKPLSEEEKATLRVWIESGAAWGTSPIDMQGFTNDRRAGRDWWALQPIKAPEQTGNATNIDAYILAKLQSRGLHPSAEADRRTLIRRVTFDLIGLAPSPEEVEAFVADPDPDAYAKLVDRLLASPHYGERWARHWLDVARYGESDGFERNTTRPNSWPYRNWVIDALNRDMPYDAFCRLQIAGDVILPHDPEAAKATGFLVAGVHNTVLGNDMMRAIAKQDELEDLVGTVGQTFLGLTVNCARCHDHKFDPITQTDYYRMASALGGVEHGERQFEVAAVANERRLATEDLLRTDEALKAIEEPIDKAILAERLNMPIAQPGPSATAAWDLRSTRSESGDNRLTLSPIAGARITSDGGLVDGKNAYFRSVPIDFPLREKTLEVWVKLDNLSQRGGGVLTVARPDGSVFDSIVFAENEPERWMAGSEGFARTKSFQGDAECSAANRVVHFAITYQSDGTVIGYRDGLAYGKPYKTAPPMEYRAGEAVITLGCRHEPAGGNRMLAGLIVKAHVYDRALKAEEVALSAKLGGAIVNDSEREAKLSADVVNRWRNLKANRKRLADRIRTLDQSAKFKAYTTISASAPITRRLIRGQLTDPAEVVTPGGVEATGPIADFKLPADAPENERRKALARWVTSTENPLFARVIVNRVWHHHFGLGLVETPNDFGFNGGRPSHPELLDALSTEFIANGYRLKDLHRKIVNSSTYRQASALNTSAREADADNRLLWRKSPRRLEAEAVRDTMLQTAGLLNREIGGRGFSDYKENFLSGTTYFDPIDPTEPEAQRLSIYRFVPRGANQGLLDTFDCPDPSANAPRRSLTTTPIQALALWNNAFVIRMSDALAARLASEIPGDPADPKILDQRVERLWKLAYQRSPRPDELPPARVLASHRGFRALGRALFNSNEFLTVE